MCLLCKLPIDLLSLKTGKKKQICMFLLNYSAFKWYLILRICFWLNIQKDLTLFSIAEKNTRFQKKIFDEQCYKIVAGEVIDSKQVLVFVHARNETENTAKEFIRLMTAANAAQNAEADEPVSFKSFIDDKKQKSILREKFHSKPLSHYASYGIGIHHAGMSRHDRNIVERLFRDGNLENKKNSLKFFLLICL